VKPEIEIHHMAWIAVQQKPPARGDSRKRVSLW
jgi:hypothetical protein